MDGDAPEIELMRRASVQSVDGVAAERDARADQEDVVVRRGGQASQRRGDDRTGVASQDVAGVHVAGVAGIACHGLCGIAQTVVVVGERNDPWTAFDADLRWPRRRERADGDVDQELETVSSLRRISEIA